MIVSSYVASELLRAMPAYKVACPSTHGQSNCLKSGLNHLREPWQLCSFFLRMTSPMLMGIEVM